MINSKRILAYFICLILIISTGVFYASAEVTAEEGEEPTIHNQGGTQESSSEDENSDSSESSDTEEDSDTAEQVGQTSEDDSATTDTQTQGDDASAEGEAGTDEVPVDSDLELDDSTDSAVEIIETVSSSKQSGSLNETISLVGYASIGLGVIGIISVIWWSLAGRKKKKTPEAIAYEEVGKAEARNRAQANTNEKAPKTTYNDSFNYDNITPTPTKRPPTTTQRAQTPTANVRKPAPGTPQRRAPQASVQRPTATKPAARPPRDTKYDTDEILKEILGKKK